jgi:hypothetical protein
MLPLVDLYLYKQEMTDLALLDYSSNEIRTILLNNYRVTVISRTVNKRLQE